jgi:hypothetical protein
MPGMASRSFRERGRLAATASSVVLGKITYAGTPETRARFRRHSSNASSSSDLGALATV